MHAWFHDGKRRKMGSIFQAKFPCCVSARSNFFKRRKRGILPSPFTMMTLLPDHRNLSTFFFGCELRAHSISTRHESSLYSVRCGMGYQQTEEHATTRKRQRFRCSFPIPYFAWNALQILSEASSSLYTRDTPAKQSSE